MSRVGCDDTVLWEDDALLVVVKPAGVPIQPDPTGDADLLTRLQKRYGALWLVHRLDRVVGGVVVFARTAAAAAALSRDVQSHTAFEKSYVAIVAGVVDGTAELRDLLFHDTRSRRAFVVDRMRGGVKEAVLTRRAVCTREAACGTTTLLDIRLMTGRFHQIRVQLASRATPILGDGKYGSRVKCPLALFAYRLSLTHPVTGRRHVFTASPDGENPWDIYREEIRALL